MNKRLKLVVLSPKNIPALRQLERFAASADIIIDDDLARLTAAIVDAEVLLVWRGSRDLIAELLPHAQRLRWIHSCWAGVETLLFPELIASNIVLTNAKGVFGNSLAEFVIGAIIYFAKDFRRLVANQMAGRWEPFDSDEISKQTVGIYGFGGIGETVGRRARAMGMRVIGCRRNPEARRGDNNEMEIVGEGELDWVLREADYFVVTAPLTNETNGRIGTHELSLLKASAVFINIGRGPIVEEEALVAALQKRKLKGAALDVFVNEPLPPGHPFYSMENVLLSPHCADHTHSWLEDTMRFFVDNLERYVRGETLRNIVDKNSGY